MKSIYRIAALSGYANKGCWNTPSKLCSVVALRLSPLFLLLNLFFRPTLRLLGRLGCGDFELKDRSNLDETRSFSESSIVLDFLASGVFGVLDLSVFLFPGVQGVPLFGAGGGSSLPPIPTCRLFITLTALALLDRRGEGSEPLDLEKPAESLRFACR
jgi:hypothetical protein